MEINQGLYPAYLLASVVLGILLGAAYDFFRVLRICRGSSTRKRGEVLLLFSEDIVFSVIAAVSSAILSYAMNRGRIRWFSLLAMALGFWLYRKTVSRAVIMTAVWLRALAVKGWNATFGRLSAWCAARLRLHRQRRHTKRVLVCLLCETEQGRWK
jgi:spore cortex biosynthesis protein YabQ